MVEYDTSIIGRVFQSPNVISVSAEMIAAYCIATGDTNPLFTDPVAAGSGPYRGIVAPPGFAATFRDREHIFEHIPRFANGGLAAGMDVEFGLPIRAGDTIRIESQLKEIYEKTGRSGTMIFIVFRSTLKNQRHEVVAHIDHRFMRRPDSRTRG